MIDHNVDGLLAEVVDDRHALQPPAVLERVAADALPRDTLAASAPLHLQALLAIQPVHALDVHVLTLASQ